MQELTELESAIRIASKEDKIADELVKMGEKRAMKVMHKNKHEIKRLEALAKDALINGKRESYIYAVGKIRGIIRKPVDADILESLWKTSREAVVNLITSAIEAEQKKKGE